LTGLTILTGDALIHQQLPGASRPTIPIFLLLFNCKHAFCTSRAWLANKIQRTFCCKEATRTSAADQLLTGHGEVPGRRGQQKMEQFQ
jgi:hypothetical protein